MNKKIEKYIQIIEVLAMIVFFVALFIFVVINYPLDKVSNENLMWIFILMDGTR